MATENWVPIGRDISGMLIERRATGADPYVGPVCDGCGLSPGRYAYRWNGGDPLRVVNAQGTFCGDGCFRAEVETQRFNTLPR